MTNEIKNVPELRFPEFEDEWKQKRLGEVAEIIGGGTPSTSNPQYWGGDINWYSPIEIGENIYLNESKNKITKMGLKKSSAKILPIGSVLFTSRAGIGNTAILKKEAATNQGFKSIVPKDNKIDTYFIFSRTNELKKYGEINGAGSTFVEVSGKEMEKMPMLFPEISEQQKIGNFFSKLDRQIELEEQKLEKLEEQKKGYMQQIFSQELRFKDEDGNIYPDWKEYVLGETGNTYSGLSSKTKEDFGYGNSYFITYMNVFKNTIAKANMIEKVNIQENEKQNKVNYKDILFTTSSEVPEETGMSSIWLYKESNVYLNSFCFGFRVTCDDIEPIYLTRFLRSEKMRKQITILSQGSTRFNISKKEAMKLKIDVPNLEEQTKIVNFLSKYDSLIESQSNKIDLLKERKKGFLQKMFV